MQIFDITQELFSSVVFPGDPVPTFERVRSMDDGSMCNLTTVSMCAHNGTHMDAPFHFIKDGITMEQLDLDRVIGNCTVVEADGDITPEVIDKWMADSEKRLLIKGADVKLTAEAAAAMNKNGIRLIGIEPQSVGMAHIELLSHEVAVLEGLVLRDIEPGNYFLSAAPVKLGGSDGAPVRAVLIRF